MNYFIENYPIVASFVAFAVATIAGAVDLIVLKNRALAILFWLWGFPVVIMPIVWKESWGDFRWLLGAVVAALYVGAVIKIYSILAPDKAAQEVEKE